MKGNGKKGVSSVDVKSFYLIWGHKGLKRHQGIDRLNSFHPEKKLPRSGIWRRTHAGCKTEHLERAIAGDTRLGRAPRTPNTSLLLTLPS